MKHTSNKFTIYFLLLLLMACLFPEQVEEKSMESLNVEGKNMESSVNFHFKQILGQVSS